jgi:hypothetical protein|tara:strand:+ start:634 stop:1110 length:477 start_codon:yes stop_codon:yes gene_type:complete
MTTTKKELITKIGGLDIPSSKLKISELYIFKLSKSTKIAFKFGKALDVESRLKAVKKDLVDWEVIQIWKSSLSYMSWLEPLTSEYEKLIHHGLKMKFTKYADKYSDRPRGYTEMYDFGKFTEWDTRDFIEQCLQELIQNPKARNLEDIRNLRGNANAI